MRSRQLSRRVPWLLASPAVFLIAWSYSLAQTDGASKAYFAVFWAGVLLFVLPAGARLISATATRVERLQYTAALGLFLFVPKYLRNPHQFLYHDELAHGRQTELIQQTGHLFSPNPILPVVSQFPGLHLVTVGLKELTGLSTFTSAELLLASVHVAALMGIFVLVEGLTATPRIVGAAVFIYAVNPSFMYFDTQYGYESLSIVFFIWILACVVRLRSLPDNGPLRRRWLALGLVLGASSAVTHHLTTYITVGMLILFSTAALVERQRSGPRPWQIPVVGLTLVIAVITAAWTALFAPDVVNYLGPRITDGARQLTQIGGGSRSAHRPFSGSDIPVFERASSFLAPVVIGLMTLTGLWAARRGQRRASPAPIVVLGLLYFPSLPLILTQAGSEGARRSWGFSFVGLALVGALAVSAILDSSPRWVRRGSRAAVLIGAAVVVLIGSVAMGLNETYRFPGPYVYGSDTRSTTAEVLALGAHMRAQYGPGRRIVADRYIGDPLAAFYGQNISAAGPGFPIWRLYFETGRPPTKLISDMRESRFDFMTVDRQMAQYLPRIGVYFQPDEPDAVKRTVPPPLEALTKFGGMPALTKVFTSDHLDLYLWNFGAIGARVRGAQ